MPEYILTSKSTLQARFIMLIAIIILLLLVGTLFYHFVEDWSYIDSFYFAAISLSTRGYGELHPTTAFSKLFTVLYLFIGVAFILYALSSFIGYFIQNQEPVIKKKMDSLVKKFVPEKKDKWLVVKVPKHYEQDRLPNFLRK